MLPPERHGLTRGDVDRTDRQNWWSAQWLSFQQVHECLQEIENESNGSPQGTRMFLVIVWYYVEIFCSPVATLKERIKYAAIVCHFLTIWRRWVMRQRGLTLKEHFLSKETYADILLSCHFAVILICYFRNNFPFLKCNLEDTGTDCVETFFSTNGQWIGNHHNYSYGDLRRNISHQIRLEQIRVDPSGPKFAKPHPKGESIWKRQYNDQLDMVDLKDYPEELEEHQYWKEDVLVVQQLAIEVGMGPDEISEDNDNFCPFPPFDPGDVHRRSNTWFYHPFDDWTHYSNDDQCDSNGACPVTLLTYEESISGKLGFN